MLATDGSPSPPTMLLASGRPPTTAVAPRWSLRRRRRGCHCPLPTLLSSNDAPGLQPESHDAATMRLTYNDASRLPATLPASSDAPGHNATSKWSPTLLSPTVWVACAGLSHGAASLQRWPWHTTRLGHSTGLQTITWATSDGHTAACPAADVVQTTAVVVGGGGLSLRCTGLHRRPWNNRTGRAFQ